MIIHYLKKNRFVVIVLFLLIVCYFSYSKYLLSIWGTSKDNIRIKNNMLTVKENTEFEWVDKNRSVKWTYMSNNFYKIEKKLDMVNCLEIDNFSLNSDSLKIEVSKFYYHSNEKKFSIISFNEIKKIDKFNYADSIIKFYNIFPIRY